MSLSRLPGPVGEITVEGNPTRVQASKTIAHDPAFYVADLQLIRREIAALNAQPEPPRKDMSYCPDCGEWRNINAFHKDPTRGNGVSQYCIPHKKHRVKLSKLRRKERERVPLKV